MEATPNRERNKYQNDWYHAHKDGVLASQREYRERNKGAINERRAQYRAAHREQLRLAELERRARMSDEQRALEGETKSRRQRWFRANVSILKRAQGCSECERRDGRLTHHHIDSASKHCNVSSMANHTLEAFLDEVAKCIVLCDSCHGRLHRMEQLGRAL